MLISTLRLCIEHYYDNQHHAFAIGLVVTLTFLTSIKFCEKQITVYFLVVGKSCMVLQKYY